MAMQLSMLELMERPSLRELTKPDELFNSDDWKFVAQQDENTRFDRKSARIEPKQLAECLSAFGNGPAVEGGVVAIGIENDGTVAGCKSASTEKLTQLELMGRDHCPGGRFETKRLAVTNCNGEDDFIVLARVHYVEDKLVELTNGDAFCRESDRSRKLTESEKQEIRINKGERAFELEPCALEWPSDFRENKIKQFADEVRRSREGSADVSTDEILVSMRLGKIKDGEFKPNNVCALMFAKDPRQVFPGSYVHFLRYEGITEGSGKDYNVVKDRVIDGSILDIIKDASTVIDANLREFTDYRNGKFHITPEYPHDAWYEVLVNACVHRSYNSRNQPIFVRQFDDRLEVESPGGFMPSVTPENLFHKPRNPFLMFVLREYGEVRCISEGTKRIKRELHSAKLPEAKYTSSTQSVKVVLRNDIANRTNSLDGEAYKLLGEAIAFSLDLDERKIINYVTEHKKINVSDALRILSTTRWHTASGKLERLRDRGILNYVSSRKRDPQAHYILVAKIPAPKR